jgi:hypothetical protein
MENITRTVVGKFYVLDTMTSDNAKRIVSGPFASSWDAELDRRERNIAGDCVVVKREADRFRRTTLSDLANGS